MDYQKKYENLIETIKPYGQAVVAFSGGVDSALLAFAAAEALGKDKTICLTARSPLFPEREFAGAVSFCNEHGFRHEVFDIKIQEIEGFSSNPPNRCYLCKTDLFTKFLSIAKERNIETVFEGSNADDIKDYRPGMQAVKKLGIKSPFLDASFSKDAIRSVSKMLGLETWNKPPMACLASRFVYGERITLKKLQMVEDAEDYLLKNGMSQVRVRILGDKVFTAKIEVPPEEISACTRDPQRAETVRVFQELGFSSVELDLIGYRTGSMNESLLETI